MYNLTLIIPAKEEKYSLPRVLDEVKDLNFKKLVVLAEDDFETREAVKNSDCEILFQTGKGYGNAIREGIKHATTKYIAIFYADGSTDPIDLKPMINKIIDDKNQIVFGSRYEKNSSSDDDTIITFIGNKTFSFIGKVFFSLPITDILYTFVLGRTGKVNNLNLQSKDFCFCVELPIKAHKNKLKLTSSPANERRRIAGKKKVNAFKDGLKILVSMFKFFINK